MSTIINDSAPAAAPVRAVAVYKAKPINPNQPTPSLAITAKDEIPNLDHLENYVERGQAIFRTDAAIIVDALYDSLPGGTLDQILRLLLERKASQLVVRA